MSLPMRVGLGQFNELTDEKPTFIKQMGCNDFLMNTLRLPGDKQWEYEDLAAYKARADAAPLRLMALENVPTLFYYKIMLGQNGREEQLQHMINTVRNMGKAGIPILSYHWIPNSVWRTPEPAVLRGGARGTRFALAEHDSEELTHGLDFCMGCWSEMGGHGNVVRAVRHFGSQGKIIYIHFRDVVGSVKDFHETFIDCGQVDTFEIVQTLKEVGFDGFMITDHVPHIVGDSPWVHRGRAHCVGFMQALIQVANKLSA